MHDSSVSSDATTKNHYVQARTTPLTFIENIFMRIY